jgi:hypothetical protein
VKIGVPVALAGAHILRQLKIKDGDMVNIDNLRNLGIGEVDARIELLMTRINSFQIRELSAYDHPIKIEQGMCQFLVKNVDKSEYLDIIVLHKNAAWMEDMFESYLEVIPEYVDDSYIRTIKEIAKAFPDDLEVARFDVQASIDDLEDNKGSLVLWNNTRRNDINAEIIRRVARNTGIDLG